MMKPIVSFFLLSASLLLATSGTTFLGITGRDLTLDRAAALTLDNTNGAEVTVVDPNTPASRAGLKEHDVIVSFNGLLVNDTDQLTLYVRQTPVGRSVRLGVMRNARLMSLPVQFAAPAPAPLVAPVATPKPPDTDTTTAACAEGAVITGAGVLLTAMVLDGMGGGGIFTLLTSKVVVGGVITGCITGALRDAVANAKKAQPQPLHP